jgi:hypothetical protein
MAMGGSAFAMRVWAGEGRGGRVQRSPTGGRLAQARACVPSSTMPSLKQAMAMYHTMAEVSQSERSA